MLCWLFQYQEIIEYSELERDRQCFSSPAPGPDRTAQQSHPVTESVFPMLLELCQAAAVTAQGRLF